jgi:tRNA pseudouridine55 synthase
LDGFLLVNKSPGPSSFAVVKRVRTLCGGARTGHAGTLDPAAAGLLIVGVGAATRLLEYLPAQPKKYTFTLRFGVETDTLDEEGPILKEGGRVPSLGEITSALPRFIGATMQEPPRFSALKVRGRRSYDRARNKEDFSLNPREISFQSLNIISAGTPDSDVVFEVSCSTGTYVRALARDIAVSLGTIGHARGIQRTEIGPFTLAEAVDFTALTPPIELIPVKTMFKTCECITIDVERQKQITLGRDILLSHEGEAGKPFFAFNENDGLVAVLTQKEKRLFHPVKVFL